MDSYFHGNEKLLRLPGSGNDSYRPGLIGYRFKTLSIISQTLGHDYKKVLELSSRSVTGGFDSCPYVHCFKDAVVGEGAKPESKAKL